MIFSYILFILLVCLCAYVIWWSFKEPLRLYQFPFFITIACLIYIVPQIFALIEDPYPVSPNYVDLTILLTILSLFLFFYGYVKKIKIKKLSIKRIILKIWIKEFFI